MAFERNRKLTDYVMRGFLGRGVQGLSGYAEGIGASEGMARKLGGDYGAHSGENSGIGVTLTKGIKPVPITRSSRSIAEIKNADAWDVRMIDVHLRADP